MLRIGEFAKLCRVSVRTLRFYEECGLLRPSRVDDFTGYRYYAASLLPRVSRILALRDLGLSLEQIAVVVGSGRLPLSVLQEMLAEKRAELARHVAVEQARLCRVEAWLQLIEEGKMSDYKIVLKAAEPQLVASQRRVIARMADLNVVLPQMFNEIYAQVGEVGSGPAGELWHDTKVFDGTDMDVETYVPISAAVPVTDALTVKTLPAVATLACVTHEGPFAKLNEAHEAIHAWMHANGYQRVPPDRCIYHAVCRGGNPDDNVCEVQYPVAKIAG